MKKTKQFFLLLLVLTMLLSMTAYSAEMDSASYPAGGSVEITDAVEPTEAPAESGILEYNEAGEGEPDGSGLTKELQETETSVSLEDLYETEVSVSSDTSPKTKDSAPTEETTEEKEPVLTEVLAEELTPTEEVASVTATIVTAVYYDLSIDYVAGDINGDGDVTISDVQLLLKYVNHQDVAVISAVLDMNGDEDVTISDVQLLLKYVNRQDVTIVGCSNEEVANLSDIPAYSGYPYVAVNDNVPFFTESDYTTISYEYYSDLDDLGRCGAATACVGQDLMPTETRGSISSVTPTGWVQATYDIVSGGYLYNRCHLIAYELTGENSNEKNLITGTRYFNVTGMLPFENTVADYVKETDNHVLYRVTPIFEGDNLLADGVLMEAMSMEDEGEDILFCVFVYNVQPGIVLDYTTGESWLEGTTGDMTTGTDISADTSETDTATEANASIAEAETSSSGEGATSATDNTSAEITYILNTNSMKFHYPDCSSVSQMSEKNKLEYTGSREEIIAMGYSPCGRCNP